MWLKPERAWLWAWLVWLAERSLPRRAARTPGSDSLQVERWAFSWGEERRAFPALGLEPLLLLPGDRGGGKASAEPYKLQDHTTLL